MDHLSAVAASFFRLIFVSSLITIGAMVMPISTKDDKLFTVREAAKYLKYSEHTIRMYIKRGLLASGKFGITVTIAKSECDRFSREKRKPGRPPESGNNL